MFAPTPGAMSEAQEFIVEVCKDDVRDIFVQVWLWFCVFPHLITGVPTMIIFKSKSTWNMSLSIFVCPVFEIT